MAKVKINKLPEGFELVDGKINRVSKKQYGGDQTGDQSDYGLVTTPQEYYGQTNFNNELDNDVRFSLNSVPRDEANVEAEGGETVLADLNSNGQFGLYNINGPRHSSGGVPMYLPEQSFIYSDTAALKFNKDEMAEFGVESGKRKTPAQISKKYQLNPYLGAINDQFADDISTLSAELMLKKNMNSLSKLAYGQELKKKFEDGVPLAAYPYLDSKGIDPIQFTAQVEEISQKQAQLNAIQSLPPNQQQAIIMLQQMIAQADQQQPERPGAMRTNNMDMSAGPQPAALGEQQLAMANNQMGQDMMAMYGLEKEQRGGQTASSFAKEKNVTWPPNAKDPVYNEETKKWDYADGTPSLTSREAIDIVRSYETNPQDTRSSRPEYFLSTTEEVESDASPNENIAVTTSTTISDESIPGTGNKIKNPLKEGHPQYKAFQDAIDRGNVVDIVPRYDNIKGITYYKLIEQNPNPLGLPSVDMIDSAETTSTDDTIPIQDADTREIMGLVEDIEGVSFRGGILSNLERDKKQPKAGPNSYGYDLSAKNLEDDMTLRWGDAWTGGTFEGANGEVITIEPIEGFDYQMKREDPRYRQQWTTVQNNMQKIDDAFSDKHGIPKRDLFAGQRMGEKVDGKLGLHTFNLDRRFLNQPSENVIDAQVEDERETPDPNPVIKYPLPEPEPWLQDRINIAAQNSLENPLILPVNPQLPRQKIDYVLDDWTGKVNNINAALNSKLNQLGAFAGRSGVMGADIGEAVKLSENAINQTNSANIGIINQIAPMQARLDMENNLQNVKLRMDQDEGTNLALQRFTDFQNWDKQKSAELMNTLLTNQANTYNLNMATDPQFNVDTTRGGLGVFMGGRPNQQTDQTSEVDKRFDQIIDLDQRLEGKGIDADSRAKYIEAILGMDVSNDSNNNDNPYPKYPGAQAAAPSVIPANPPNSSMGKSRRGKEVGRAFPFSVGKMGR
tara:strand:- start:3710 stop:6580 length:2871 start_codon:yes stop_codon:yes gene_type:complete